MKQIQVPDQSLTKLRDPGAKQTQFSCEELDQCAVHFGVQIKEGGKYKSKKKLFEDIQAAAKKQGVKVTAPKETRLPPLRLERALMEIGYSQKNNIWNVEEFTEYIIDGQDVYDDYWAGYYYRVPGRPEGMDPFEWGRRMRQARNNPRLEEALRTALGKVTENQPGVVGNIDPLDWQFRYFEWVLVDHPALPEVLDREDLRLHPPENMTDFDRQVMEIKYPGFYEKIDGIVDQVRSEAPFTDDRYWTAPSKFRSKAVTAMSNTFDNDDKKYGWDYYQIHRAIQNSKLPISSRQLHMLAPDAKNTLLGSRTYSIEDPDYYAFIYEAMRRYKEKNPELVKLLGLIN